MVIEQANIWLKSHYVYWVYRPIIHQVEVLFYADLYEKTKLYIIFST